jgi:Zn-finger nucleic acid-binding protein
MKCPVDSNELTISDRQGVEIDFCPQCRGVWLDRGELDKIIERSANFDDRGGRGRNERRRDDDDDEEGGIGGFFGRLFDFG